MRETMQVNDRESYQPQPQDALAEVPSGGRRKVQGERLTGSNQKVLDDIIGLRMVSTGLYVWCSKS
jgi:hypothetical protein